MTSIGVISDTHSLLRPEAVKLLQGSELIIHAGDIGSIEVIDQLNAIAPVTAVRGNIDKSPFGDRFAEYEVLKVNGKYVFVLHDLKELDLDPVAAGFDVIVSGHTHVPQLEDNQGVLYLNPGSAGPRRFSLPIALARLDISDSGIEAKIMEIEC